MRTAPTNRTASPDATRTQAMADTMAKTARERGSVTRRDLIAEGFTPGEIDRLGDEAMARAANRINPE